MPTKTILIGRYKSSITGFFVSHKYAKSHPKTTFCIDNKPKKRFKVGHHSTIILGKKKKISPVRENHKKGIYKNTGECGA